MAISKSLKKTFFAVGGFAGLLALITVALYYFVDINSYKPRLEAAASDALGMEVKVGGKMGFSFFPGLQVTLDDVHIRNSGTDLISAKEARLGIKLFPLLHEEVLIAKIALDHPSVYIERDSKGKFNFETPVTSEEMLPALDLAKISFSDWTLVYADKQSGEGFEATDCKLDVRRLLLSQGKSADLMKDLSFTAEFACAEIRAKDLTLSDFKFSADVKNGVFDIKPFTMSVFGGQGTGNIQADLSGAVPNYHVEYSLPQFRIETFYKTLSQLKVLEGAMDFYVNVSMQGKTVNDMTKTANGNASLRGENLTLIGNDLDLQFSRYESSQHFSLVDVGAIFLSGPVGLAITKGYDLAKNFRGSGGDSKIQKVVSEWKVEHGVAHAQEVAMATNKNRIVLMGGLDFVNGRFDDMTVALIDDQGCAKLTQKVSGPFQKPVVEKPNILVALAGPALRLLKTGRDILPGGECEVIYTGSVAPP